MYSRVKINIPQTLFHLSNLFFSSKNLDEDFFGTRRLGNYSRIGNKMKGHQSRNSQTPIKLKTKSLQVMK